MDKVLGHCVCAATAEGVRAARYKINPQCTLGSAHSPGVHSAAGFANLRKHTRRGGGGAQMSHRLSALCCRPHVSLQRAQYILPFSSLLARTLLVMEVRIIYWWSGCFPDAQLCFTFERGIIYTCGFSVNVKMIYLVCLSCIEHISHST
jgi:hypothetical protein